MKTIPQIVEEQIHRWQITSSEKKEEKEAVSVVTVSRDPGSGGRIVAQKLAEKLGFDVFHREVVHEMAQSADVSKHLLKTLDEKGLNVLEDWISSLVYDRHLWPDEYLQILMKVIGTIGRHGRAVIIGRGANFILPQDRQFRIRITAPQSRRIERVARDFSISQEEAKRRIIHTESDRKAFVRKYFNADIADPINYDLIINTETLSVDNAVDVISAALGCLVECRV
jgi:cytidylate kinase